MLQSNALAKKVQNKVHIKGLRQWNNFNTLFIVKSNLKCLQHLNIFALSAPIWVSVKLNAHSTVQDKLNLLTNITIKKENKKIGQKGQLGKNNTPNIKKSVLVE